MSIKISYSKVVAHAKKIEKKNLKERGKSLTWNSMMGSFKIHESYHDSDMVIVDENWKDQFNSY